jgi:hypothetical protein
MKLKQLLKESTTDTFVIRSSDKKLVRANGNVNHLFADKKIDLAIEVFASGNHISHAKRILDVITKAGLVDKYFTIKISVR